MNTNYFYIIETIKDKEQTTISMLQSVERISEGCKTIENKKHKMVIPRKKK